MEEHNTEQAPEQNMEQTTPESNDDSTGKIVAILGYIFPIIFFLPLVMDKKGDAFAMHHANQHLNLLISWIALNIIAIIPILGWIAWFVGAIALLVFTIMGIINAASGKSKELPVIGGWKLLK